MISTIVSFDELLRCERWKAEIFTDAKGPVLDTDLDFRPMAELAAESKTAVDPASLEDTTIIYVGLENVEPVTGEPLDLSPQPPSAIRSRSKPFLETDVLYGRLRPYLRKAYLARPPYGHGICSTEFLVLRPNKELIAPEVFRALLISEWLTQQIARFQVGAALPRISSRDFFSLALPVPPMEVQLAWLEKIRELETRYRQARAEVGRFPSSLDESIKDLVSGGVGPKGSKES